jgi:hypothetical protein
MAQIHQPAPVKLIAGLLAARAEWLDVAAVRLAELFGPIELASPDWAFDFTHYYDKQMGENLLRRFVAFAGTVDPETLGATKRRTNELEAELAEQFPDFPRPVNIDPGYVAPSKLVLASMKDFAHRVYLGGGVYAEVTLRYVGGQWQSMPFTFPDYASGRYDAFLSAARELLMKSRANPASRAGQCE